MLRTRALQQFARSALSHLSHHTEGVLAGAGPLQPTACGPSLIEHCAHRRSWQSLDRRGFASAGGGGGDGASSSGSPDQPTDATAGGSAVAQGGAAVAVEGQDVLEQWGAAMEVGDWERAWSIFETEFPVDSEEFPPLEDLLSWDPEGEERSVRRQREMTLQEETARARVRKVDDQGRSHGVGKRKTSVARVWLREGSGHMMVNRRPYDQLFATLSRRNDLITPFLITSTLGQFDVMAAVHGGGIMGQAQALRHGIARALQAWDPALRPELKAAGLLTRDPRVVERKKPGLKKARKAFQWVKR